MSKSAFRAHYDAAAPTSSIALSEPEDRRLDHPVPRNFKRRLVDRQRRELLGSKLLGVQGVIERDGDVVHLVARRLFDRGALLGELEVASRDFH